MKKLKKLVELVRAGLAMVCVPLPCETIGMLPITCIGYSPVVKTTKGDISANMLRCEQNPQRALRLNKGFERYAVQPFFI